LAARYAGLLVGLALTGNSYRGFAQFLRLRKLFGTITG
jgi:hypothetical protein